MGDLRFDMLRWQQKVFTDPTRFKVVVAGRRCGKTRMSAVTMLVTGLGCKHLDATVLYVAPTYGMAKTLMWDLLISLGQSVITNSNVNDGEITLINGVKLRIRGADNPDSLRGMKLGYAVIDEMKDIKPTIYELIIRPALSDLKAGALIIGTPEPGDSLFREYFDLGESGEDSEWKSWHFTTEDNELIDPREIAAARRSMSTMAFSQEYLASFDSMGENIFKESWLLYGEDAPKQGDTYIAVDPAGFEAVSDPNKKKHLDNTAIAVVTVNDLGKWWVRKIEYGRWDARETATRILMAIRTHKPMSVGIERGALQRALMPYLTDLMRKNNVYAHIEAIAIGGGSKTNRITYNLQGLFEHGRITLNKRENWDQFKKEYCSFPSPKAHDDCFPADAPIITNSGIKTIAEVTTDDLVLTRNGFRKVIKVWCKGHQPVITRFGITATKDHRIWTDNKGWVDLDSLCASDILLTAQPIEDSSCEKQSISTDGTTTGILTQSSRTTSDTTHLTTSGNQPQGSCIETFGRPITDKSLMDTTSIMQTKTSTTTISPTLFASQVPHIKWSIEKKEANEQHHQSIWSTLTGLETEQNRGIPLRKGWSGIGNTRSTQSGKTFQSKTASYVDHSINQRSASLECAAKSANEQEGTTCSESGGVPVYDMMVEEDHEFFAYGALVHNCIDSLSLVANLVTTTYAKQDDSEEWEPMDVVSGL